MSLTIDKVLPAQPFEAAIDHVRRALSEEGFGVLSDIDVQATFKKKLDVDFPNYRILGACNPTLAHTALSQAPAIGVLLPCNVVVRTCEDGRIRVSIADPHTMFSTVNIDGMDALVNDAAARLNRVAESL